MSLQNSLRRNWMPRQLLLFYWLNKYPVFWLTVFSQHSVRPLLATYPWLCSTCVTYRTPCRAIGNQVFRTPAFKVIPHTSVSYRQVFRKNWILIPTQLIAEWFATLPQRQNLPREVENFPRGERYFKHTPLITCLIYLSPKKVYW